MILKQYCCPYSLHCGLDIWDLLTTHGKFVSLNSFDSKPLGFPGGSAGKESACNAGDLGSIPGLGRSPGEEKGYPLRYSSLENSMNCIVHGVAKSQRWLSDFHLVDESIKNVFSVFKFIKGKVHIWHQLDRLYNVQSTCQYPPIRMVLFFYFYNFIYLFGCAGSWLLCRL